jgi:hypothetical protein
VFILFAIPVGIGLGYLLGGRLDRLATLDFRWGGLAVAGLVAQLLLFSAPVAAVVGAAGPPLYLLSTVAVLAAVLRNVRRIPGLILVAIGAAANLAAILANGGVMPASAEAVATAGLADIAGFSNSVVVADPALRPLTDIFALPAALPFANVFSLGDVLIGLGIVVVLAMGMRGRTAERRTPTT